MHVYIIIIIVIGSVLCPLGEMKTHGPMFYGLGHVQDPTTAKKLIAQSKWFKHSDQCSCKAEWFLHYT